MDREKYYVTFIHIIYWQKSTTITSRNKDKEESVIYIFTKLRETFIFHYNTGIEKVNGEFDFFLFG